jgi:quercetin dioxygenase-like cupin family protein
VAPQISGVPLRDHSALLADAMSQGPQNLAGIAAAVTQVRERLPWVYHYAPRAGEADLADRIAFAEFIGPEAPLRVPSVRIGFTLIAPHTAYPLHAHPAVELYWVLYGHARWAARQGERVVPPGDFVLHDSGEPHAMHTAAEPLLALWGWSGDIDTPAFYTGDAGPGAAMASVPQIA